MNKENVVDAYNKLLNAVLDYLQGNKAIDYKQSNLIMQYVKQNDESEKLVKRKKIDKILLKIDKFSREKHYIAIPDYYDLEELEGSRLKHIGGDYLEKKEIRDMLGKRIDSRRSGPRNNIYDFLRFLISDVKCENEKLTNEKKQQQEEKSQISDEQTVRTDTFNFNYSNPRTDISQSYERKEDIKTKERIEEKNANDSNTVKDIMLREEKAFDEAVKSANRSKDFGKSYSLAEKERKAYLKEILSVTIGQKYMAEDCKKLDNSVAGSMIMNAGRIEDLIVQNLLEVNFKTFSEKSELYKQTLIKSKYNPHKLLEQYKKLYERYMKQFDKLPEEEKRRIAAVCENNGMKSISSPEDIITKVNSRLQEKMVEYEVGTHQGDSGKLCGSYGLTTYMKPEQIARTERIIREKVEKLHEPRSVLQYEIDQEWNRAWRLNSSGVSKESIRKDLEEKNRKVNEAILQKKNEKERNLQYNYSTAVYVKENENRSLTQICREVLHEEPMFEEPKKGKESKALIEKDKVNGFSFKSIKAAIARALDRKGR